MQIELQECFHFNPFQKGQCPLLLLLGCWPLLERQGVTRLLSLCASPGMGKTWDLLHHTDTRLWKKNDS